MKKILLGMILGLTLTSCATSPIDTEYADFVPERRIYNIQYLTKQKNTFALTIKRDAGFVGSLCSIAIYLNSSRIADIRTGEKIVLYLPQKEYILSADNCDGSSQGVDIVMDRDRVFRVGLGLSQGLILAPTTF